MQQKKPILPMSFGLNQSSSMTSRGVESMARSTHNNLGHLIGHRHRHGLDGSGNRFHANYEPKSRPTQYGNGRTAVDDVRINVADDPDSDDGSDSEPEVKRGRMSTPTSEFHGLSSSLRRHGRMLYLT